MSKEEQGSKRKGPNTDRRTLPSGRQGPLIAGGRYGYRREDRRRCAREMAEAGAKRTPKERVEILDQRLGEGAGACRERGRLTLMIEKGFGDTPLGQLPKDWYLGKNSKTKSKKSKAAEAE